jgi:double-GTPase-like protein
MICPYCAEDVAAGSQQHQACKRASDKPFPPLYIDHHAGEAQPEPVVVSVIGFPNHGKTIFLCALFDYLDDQLTYVWRNKFHKLVLDQESLSQLNDNRSMLRRGELPPPTELDFPRPGIFRLKHMPSTSGNLALPPLVDTTILIYDPPGEAFRTEGRIVDYASFVNRSNCVLFLIDLTALGTSIAQGMAELLETYVLGMRRMGIRQQSQHLIVVYTKSDEMKISVPEFASLLERQPWLRDYLEEQRPATLADPGEHFKQLEKVSNVLADFTWSDLKAANFVNVADDWFASISYTAVSSLGSAPEFQEVEVQGDDAAEADPRGDNDASPDSNNEKVSVVKRLTTEMSPRGMADPLLYVLAKSLSRRPPQVISVTRPQSNLKNGWFKNLLDKLPSWVLPVFAFGAGTLAIVVVLAIVLLLALLSWAWPVSATVSATKQNISTNKAPNTVERGRPSYIDRSTRGNSICA